MKESNCTTTHITEQFAVYSRWIKDVPGIGWMIGDIEHMGICSLSDFVGKDPELLYRQWLSLKREQKNIVAQAIFRAAVYIANTPADQQEPSLSQWWNWGDSRT